MEKKNFSLPKKAWVVAADMGYGHQRTAYALRDVAFLGHVINANNYDGIPEQDRRLWNTTRSFYEFVSRFRKIPVVGITLFLFLDSFQQILGYYPKRDLSKSTLSGKLIFRSIRRGWGRDLIMRLQKENLPIITTFFTVAFMAEYFNYPNDIYCVICDADIARVWAAPHPQKSRIKYLVPNTWARDRLLLYGVKPGNIILTGYPLPKENIGGNLEIARHDMANRLLNLDPLGKYRKVYSPLIKEYLGELPLFSNHPLTVMFSIGGAGAQKEIALQIMRSFKEKIQEKKLRFIVSVGSRNSLKAYFENQAKHLQLDGWFSVLHGKTTKEYFDKFNQALRTVDILMTKPSELSFFSGLGIPIVIQPPIGSQEDFNKRWLMHTGAAVLQENPAYTDQWLFDLLQTGDFAEMAMEGFVEIEKRGSYNIEKIISG